MASTSKKRPSISFLLWGALLVLLPGPKNIWSQRFFAHGRLSYTAFFNFLDRLPQVLGFLLLWFGCAKLPPRNQQRLNNVFPLLLAFIAVGQAYCVYAIALQTVFSVVCLCAVTIGQIWMTLWIQRLPVVLETEKVRPIRRRIIPAVYAALSAVCVLGAVIPGKPSLLIILSRISRVVLVGFSFWLLYDLYRTAAAFSHPKHARTPQG